MKKIMIIAAKEYRTYFTGLMAYAVGGLFTFLMSLMFYFAFARFANVSMQLAAQGGKGTINDYVFAMQFGNVNLVLLIIIPALTMRLFAEEKRNRTMDLLMTSPLTATEIVVGKFLAGCLIVWSILAIMVVYPLTSSLFTTFDKGPVLTSFLGLFLISGVYVSIGVFASSLTENGIIAFVLAFVISLFFWVVGWASVSMDSPAAQSFFNYVSIISHFGDFTKGVIDVSSVVYYLSLIFFFGFLTQRVVESARWR